MGDALIINAILAFYTMHLRAYLPLLQGFFRFLQTYKYMIRLYLLMLNRYTQINVSQNFLLL